MPCKDAMIFQMSSTIHRAMPKLSVLTLTAEIYFNHGAKIRTGTTKCCPC